MTIETTAGEVAELIAQELLVTFSVYDEDDMVPLRKLMADISVGCGCPLTDRQLFAFEEEVRWGDLRARFRVALEGLAARGVL